MALGHAHEARQVQGAWASTVPRAALAAASVGNESTATASRSSLSFLRTLPPASECSAGASGGRPAGAPLRCPFPDNNNVVPPVAQRDRHADSPPPGGECR